MESADADGNGEMDRDEFIDFLNDQGTEEVDTDGEKSSFEKDFDEASENFSLFHGVILSAR